MRYWSVVRLGLGAAVAVLLAGAGTATAQSGRPTAPPTSNWQGGSKAQTGSTASVYPTRQQNLGVWSSGPSTGGTVYQPQQQNLGVWSSGTGGNSGAFGGTSGWTLGGGAGYYGGLLSPEMEMLVLMETLMTAEALIEQLGLEFDNSLEILVFVLTIYEMKYQEALQGILGSVTGNTGTVGNPILGGSGL